MKFFLISLLKKKTLVKIGLACTLLTSKTESSKCFFMPLAQGWQIVAAVLLQMCKAVTCCRG